MHVGERSALTSEGSFMQSVLHGFFLGVVVENNIYIYIVPLGLALYAHTLHVASNAADSLTLDPENIKDARPGTPPEPNAHVVCIKRI